MKVGVRRLALRIWAKTAEKTELRDKSDRKISLNELNVKEYDVKLNELINKKIVTAYKDKNNAIESVELLDSYFNMGIMNFESILRIKK